MPLLALLACLAGPPPSGGDDTADAPPGVEVCNGQDDDGDGAIDEFLLVRSYADADGDGFGDDATAVEACALPPGHSVVGGDCDDADGAIHPDAAEVCATLADDDCDGAANPVGAAGCVDTYADADGDGLGDGPAVCRCDPGDALRSGGDCDPVDVDRGLDCTEGAVVPMTGARVRDDDDALAWTLLGAADVDGAAGDELLVQTTDSLAAVSIPVEDGEGADGDTTLGASWLGSVALTPGGHRVFGALDGDGIPDLVEADYTAVVDPTDPERFTVTAALRGWRGPILAAPTPAWSWTLDPVVTRSVSASHFVGDLDGDGIDEAWYASGTSPALGDGEAALWRATEAGVVELVRATEPGALHLVAPLGDLDGDGLVDLGALHVGVDSGVLSVFPGPVTDTLPASGADVETEPLLALVALGDLDGDGYDDLALRGERIHVLRGPLRDGAAQDLAAARIGPESDDVAESALFVTAGDVGADGTRDLVVTDTYWPGRVGTDPLRGAIYVFDGLPDGVVDVRAAATRSYGAAYGAFGAYPRVLDDGRVLVGAHLETHADGRGVFWLLDGLAP